MARLPYRRWSEDPPVDAASVADSDVLAAIIGVAGANRVVTFADAVIAGLGVIATAVVRTVHLVDEAVTDAKLRNSAGVSVIGRSTNTTGSPADIVAGSNNRVLKRKGNVLQFERVETADLIEPERLSSVSHWANSSTPSVGAVALIHTTSSLTIGGTVSGSSHTQAFIHIDSVGSRISAFGTTLPGMYRVIAIVARFSRETTPPESEYAYLAQRIS